MKDMNSLPHTKWNCKYHIVFALKYRRKKCNVHMFVEISPELSISSLRDI